MPFEGVLKSMLRSFWKPQNKIPAYASPLKLIDGFGKLTYQERLEKLKLPTMAYRRLRGDLIEIHKHFHRYDQDVLPSSFKRRTRPSRQHEYQIYELNPGDG